jgi:hypothetical protein
MSCTMKGGGRSLVLRASDADTHAVGARPRPARTLVRDRIRRFGLRCGGASCRRTGHPARCVDGRCRARPRWARGRGRGRAAARVRARIGRGMLCARGSDPARVRRPGRSRVGARPLHPRLRPRPRARVRHSRGASDLVDAPAPAGAARRRAAIGPRGERAGPEAIPVDVCVDDDGVPVRVQLRGSTGRDADDRRLSRAASEWRFEPLALPEPRTLAVCARFLVAL